jgi:hypothetical protein
VPTGPAPGPTGPVPTAPGPKSPEATGPKATKLQKAVSFKKGTKAQKGGKRTRRLRSSSSR